MSKAANVYGKFDWAATAVSYFNHTLLPWKIPLYSEAGKTLLELVYYTCIAIHFVCLLQAYSIKYFCNTDFDGFLIKLKD